MASLFEILLRIPAALIALTVGSFARHFAAYTQGDNTPKIYGKLTLLPTEHIDPVGFLMMVFFRFGWSKQPVVNFSNFKHGKLSMLIFFIASPIFNLLTAIIMAIILSLIQKYNLNFIFVSELSMIIYVTILFNISFASIAFIPIPPFTGYYIIKEFLPNNIKYKIGQIERYSFLFLILFIYTGVLTFILKPIYMFFYNIVSFFGVGLI